MAVATGALARLSRAGSADILMLVGEASILLDRPFKVSLTARCSS
jgi:hypothetical protein